MEADITPFAYGDQQVRVIAGADGQPQFVAQDVCDVLGISNSRDALSRLDEDEKGVGTTDTLEDLIDGWLTGRYTEDK